MIVSKTSVLSLGILTLFVIGSFSFSVFAQDLQFSIFESKNNIDNTKFVPEQLIVGLEKPDPNFHVKASLNGGQVIASINQINAHLFKVPINAEENFIQAMSTNPNVQYVERNGIVKAFDNIPNDSFYPHQWGTQRIGMNSTWSPAFDDGSGITIAVIDEGLFYDHPDFAGTTIRTDIDKDFVNDDFDTRPTSNCFTGQGFVSESHGTWVTGVIAATINNNLGIAGVGQFDILPLRVLNACGSGNLFDVADAIIYAAEKDANVINLSLGHESWNHNTLENAINFASAYPDDIVVVAASGNGGNSLISYPAGFEKVISVGATDFNDDITDYSQYGPSIDLSAPGGSDLSSACSPSSQITWILTTGMDANQVPGYYCVSGTSFAAPLVAATAGLLKALNPCATDEDIKSHLEQTALDLGAPGRDDFYGHGRVSADTALSTTLIPTFSCGPDTTPPILSIPADTDVEDPAPSVPSATGTATATDDSDPNPSVTYSDSSAPDTDPQILEVITRTWTATDASNNSASEDQIITVKETPVVTGIIHVGDLNWQASDKKNWNVKVWISVHSDDSNHSPVSGVFVLADFNGDNVNCTTDDTGICQVNKTTKLDQLTFTVISLDSTLVSELSGHHDDDGDFDDLPGNLPTATIDRGENSIGSNDDGGNVDPGPNCPANGKSNKPGC